MTAVSIFKKLWCRIAWFKTWSKINSRLTFLRSNSFHSKSFSCFTVPNKEVWISSATCFLICCGRWCLVWSWKSRVESHPCAVVISKARHESWFLINRSISQLYRSAGCGYILEARNAPFTSLKSILLSLKICCRSAIAFSLCIDFAANVTKSILLGRIISLGKSSFK